MAIDHGRIHRNGWRQGGVFTPGDSRAILDAHREQLQLPELPADTRLIVTSHSCDVVARADAERFCEVCPAAPLPAEETVGMKGRGRHPRQLRLPIVINGQSVLHEMNAPLRFCIDRGRLVEVVPDGNALIPDVEVAGLELWLANRFRRRALPDAFDRRLGGGHDPIRKALSRVNDHVHHLLFSLSPQNELDDEATPYRIIVVILAKTRSMREAGVMAELESARDRIEEVLAAKRGIEAQVHILGDETMTYAQFETFSQWGFEDLSVE